MEIEGGGAGDKQSSSEKKAPSKRTQPSDTTTSSTTTRQHQQQQHSSTSSGHQLIAVSASKGPAAFFNLARKFLATDEFCDLSALEGAIVSAVDAAHLLERSKLADIIRYVQVCAV